jgi:signal transduction histidine kinase
MDPERLWQSVDSLLSLNKLASTRIQEIVRNLRNFARLDESELKTVDLHEGIESTLLLLQSSIDPRISIVREYSSNLPAIQCYPGLLNQVFMNLLVNASHAIREPDARSIREERADIVSVTSLASPIRLDNQNGQDRISIHTDYLANSGMARVVIRDTGKGITPENLQKVFDPGFTTKGVGVGTGLGLALCYRIVEKHQGRIFVESVVNEGTAFTVEIPIRPQLSA